MAGDAAEITSPPPPPPLSRVGPPPSRAELQSFLQEMYKEQCAQARQHETMRQQAMAIALTLVAAVVSLATASGGALAFLKKSGDLSGVSPFFFALYSLLGLFVIGIGRHGRKLSLKHYERNRMHTARSRTYRRRMEELFPCYGFRYLRREADATHANEWRSMQGNAAHIIDERLYMLWGNLFGFLNWVGIFLIVIPLIIATALSWQQLTKPVLGIWAWVGATSNLMLMAMRSAPTMPWP